MSVDLDPGGYEAMRSETSSTKNFRHVLVPNEEASLLEWVRVQTGSRSLAQTIALLVRIACTPEGLSFIKNHPLSPSSVGHAKSVN